MRLIATVLFAVSLLMLGGCASSQSVHSGGDCDENTPVDPDDDYSVTISFWPSSQLKGAGENPAMPDPKVTPPRISLEFTWTDPKKCFVWIREVSKKIGGGKRVNCATDFSLTREADGTLVFSYRQNARRCCKEFKRDGTVKTFRSDVLTIDESTGQTGAPLFVGVTASRMP